MTNHEAHRLRVCLNCGEPDAILLLHRDGRLLRACRPCLSTPNLEDWMLNTTPRDPLPKENPSVEPIEEGEGR